MNDAFNSMAAVNLLNNARQLILVQYTALDNLGLSSQLLKLLDEEFRLGLVDARAGYNDKMHGPPFDHPCCQTTSKASKGTDQDVSCIGIKRCSVCNLFHLG